MSSENHYLVMRLVGPLQSWGFDSQYNRRNTGLMPTKSAIAGMCCAAFGYNRGSDEEEEFLAKFGKLRMTAIAIPRIIKKQSLLKEKTVELKVRRMHDYHTVQNTRKADGGIKDCHITNRQYLSDASFGVLLEGEKEFLQKISKQLKDPVWGIWLGRKTCVPAAPVFVGLSEAKEKALGLLGINEIEKYTSQVETNTFSEGRDSIPDNPISFASGKRLFSPRRIRTELAKR
jgi:CRISPR system Cascade subunit CasD